MIFLPTQTSFTNTEGVRIILLLGLRLVYHYCNSFMPILYYSPLARSVAIRIDDRVQYDINVVSSCGYRQFTLLIIRIFLLHRARAD